jgi:hypothetical protein
MSRVLVGVALIVVAIALTVGQPPILDGWGVFVWWLAIGLLVVGVLNIGRAIIERWEDQR